MLITAICLIAGCVMTCGFIITLQVSTVRLSRKRWQELIDLLKPAYMPGITLVALEALSPHHTPVACTPDERFKEVGGMRGVLGLRANASVLLALASHAERWDALESKRAALRIRSEGLALRRAAFLLMIGSILRFSTARRTRYVQCIAVSYCQIIESLLGLYAEVQAPLGQTLDHVIWGTSADPAP